MSFLTGDVDTGPPGIKDGGVIIVAVSTTSCGICILLVAARVIFAGTQNGRIRWDCVWAVAATVVGLLSHTMIILSAIEGLGQHIYDLSGYHQAAKAMKWYWISVLIYFEAMCLAKISIVALLLSVWCPWQTKRRYFLHFIWISNLLIAFTQTGLSLGQCHPTERLWDYSIATGDCKLRMHALYFSYFQGAWSTMTDLILAVYPILVMRDIKADLRTKVGFCVLMGGGFISAIACIIRVITTHKLILSLDTTGQLVAPCVAGTAELWLIILLGSIPPLKPLFMRILRYPSRGFFVTTIPSGSTCQSAASASRKKSAMNRLSAGGLRDTVYDPGAENEERAVITLQVAGISEDVQEKQISGGNLQRMSLQLST